MELAKIRHAHITHVYSINNFRWNKLIASCSNITIDKELKSIKATDCVNGTWIEDLGRGRPVNYTVLTKIYEEYR